MAGNVKGIAAAASNHYQPQPPSGRSSNAMLYAVANFIIKSRVMLNSLTNKNDSITRVFK